MTFFRSYIAPLLIVLTFVVAMVAVSARIFLPSDMMAPAPIEPTAGVESGIDSPLDIRSTSSPDGSDVSWQLPERSIRVGRG